MAASVQDGAFAWLLCFACFFNITILGGFIFASGIFYIMFKDSLDATDGELSLITSINISLMHLICPLAGMLSERYGYRCIAMVGAVLSTAGLAAAAFSTQIYQLYISYGFIAGIGLGMAYTSTVPILDVYFNKYKRIACGLTLTGFGVGSFIIPPVLKYLEDVYGWRGAILIMAGINVHMVVSCSLFRPFEGNTNKNCNEKLKEKIKIMEQHSENEMKLLSKEENIVTMVESTGFRQEIIRAFSLIKIIPFLYLCVASIIYTFPVSIVVTHFGSYVLTIGLSSEHVVKLYMTFGLTAAIARPLAGVIAQVTKANAANFIMITMLMQGIVTLAIPLMNQLWMLYVYAVMFQLLMAPYNVLGAVIIMEHVPTSKVATAYGLFQFVCVPGFVLGAPVAVWLYQCTKVYAHSFILAGGLIILAALPMAPAAYHIHKRRTQTKPPKFKSIKDAISVQTTQN